MSKWKLCRLLFGTEEFIFEEGDEVTIGRGLNNTITLSSLVISRNHCMLSIQENQLIITDLKSSNGVFVGTKKITPNVPYVVKELDIIGIGWAPGVPLGKVQDDEKFVFEVVKLTSSKRFTFQLDNEFCDIEKQVACLDRHEKLSSPILEVKPTLKRKINTELQNAKVDEKITIKDAIPDVISIISTDSDNNTNSKKQDNVIKKPKLEPICDDKPVHENNFNVLSENECKNKPADKKYLNIKPEDECENKAAENNYLNIKSEMEFMEFEAFNVKQEHFGYDDEPIQIDSDSDSESEHWYLRLSQSSPGKPFTKVPRENKVDTKPEENSYSQMDDDLIPHLFIDDEEDYMDDLITIPPQPPSNFKNDDKKETLPKCASPINEISNNTGPNLMSVNLSLDVIDGSSSKIFNKDNTNSSTPLTFEPELGSPKKAQMIKPLTIATKKKPTKDSPQSNNFKTSKHKNSKHSSKKYISNSQKEERKKKLKEIACKEKEGADRKYNSNQNDINAIKSVPNVKVTSSNRGAFLTDSVQVVKPMNRKENVPQSKPDKDKSDVGKELNKMKSLEPTKKECSELEEKLKQDHDNINDKKKKSEKNKNHSKHSNKSSSSKSKTKKSKSDKSLSRSSPETRVPLKSLKPLTDSEDSFAGKPFSKVEPLPPKKSKKTVRFSEAQPKIHYFEIEEGNKMKKTSMAKTTLVDARQMPIFSLEKITLMKILRWNPHWLEEQIICKDPPPILGHNNPPLAIFHSFVNHNQYVQLIGDLLLMEIWECLSLAHKKIRNQSYGLQMRIASLPPVPSQECNFDLFTLSVDVSMPTSEVRNLPRVSEVLLVLFGPENAKIQRFFFVHNVRCLPSPPSNRNSFFNISLQATFTEKMRILKPGDVMIGLNLASIKNELSLFEAMAYLALSPLSEAILKPQPRHFMRNDNVNISMESQWTSALNNSQQMAVKYSVSAALGDQPSIQMVQGPPGTGKSSVICAIVMTYFYDPSGKKHQNRGKILICATSNAAVDELVLRLLNIRQSLPKSERFRMVRVGRTEAMHPRARDVSSLQLAQRDATRVLQEPSTQSGLSQEISHLEAKINMWKSAAQDASEKDPMRVAYCQGRVTELIKRIALLRGNNGAGGSDAPRPEQLVATERRIIEGADIVVTTLASAHNHKMRGLKRRIALCIVDEAGQAIEPETLIPLTLDVTKMTLIGDPQQLPGFICSPRAKKHGLGDSLFSRLSSCSETWGVAGAVVLLDVQYRMQAAIADYPNRAFYGGRMRSAPPPRPAPLPLLPYALVGVSSGDRGQNASGANEIEAWGVSRIATALAEQLRPRGLSLAVITPYNAHKDLIKKYLRILGDSEAQVEVNTVDSFQGQERDVVVVSLARSCGVGFLTDAGRMNVMLTRARLALLVCLNPLAVLKNHLWRTLLEDSQKRKLYTTLPIKMCQANSAVSNEEVLKQIAI